MYGPIFSPWFSLGVPILDVAWSIIRRTAKGGDFAKADAEHRHHRLMRLGHGQRRAVFILWAWTALLSGFVLVPTLSSGFRQFANRAVPFAVAALGLALYTMFHPGVRDKARADPPATQWQAETPARRVPGRGGRGGVGGGPEHARCLAWEDGRVGTSGRSGFVATWRMYEPRASFEGAEREHWDRYVADRPAAPSEREVSLEALVRRTVPDPGEHAHVLDVDGVTLISPWRTAVRSQEGLLDFCSELPDLLSDAFVPPALLAETEVALDRWRAERGHLVGLREQRLTLTLE